MNHSSILLLGSIALDTIETSHGKQEHLLGGSATYAALASSKFLKPKIVGIVGSDFSKENLKILEDSCENLQDLQIRRGSTFRWGGKYSESGDERETLFTDLGVFENFTPHLSSFNKNPDYIFLANISPDLQLNILSQCENKPFVILDTMNLWIDIAKNDLLDVIKKSDILLINESELMQLSEKRNFAEAASDVLKWGPKTLIVKYGSKGAVCYSNEKSFSIGVIQDLVVKDPTGAGDSFGGGLVSALAEGLSMEQAMIRGTAMASFCIENFGINAILNAEKSEIEIRCSYLLNTINYKV